MKEPKPTSFEQPITGDETDPAYWQQFITPASLAIAAEAGEYRQQALEKMTNATPICPTTGELGHFLRLTGAHNPQAVYRTDSGVEFIA